MLSLVWQSTASPAEDAGVSSLKSFDRCCRSSAAGQHHHFRSSRKRSPILTNIQSIRTRSRRCFKNVFFDHEVERVRKRALGHRHM